VRLQRHVTFHAAVNSLKNKHNFFKTSDNKVKLSGECLSVIPIFELGLWNAWILVVPILVVFFFAMRATAARESGKAADFQLTRIENIIANASFYVMLPMFGYAIFLPLQLDTIWLYSGLTVYLFGIVFTTVAILNFATSPKDAVITNGLYSFSRNPMEIGMLLMQIGLGITCSSWLYLLLVVVLMILLNANSSAEERFCLYRYGDEYQKYMNRTPRWIGTSKSQEKD
jgi:protein-S-isoprenylcysteine O-methyltransferase Ste14